MKVLTSKLGLKFSISEFNRPSENDVVFFTQTEWEWMKEQNLKPDEFRLLWLLKKENYTYDPIPEGEKKKEIAIGVKIAEEIINQLKGARGGSKNSEGNQEPES